MVAKKRVFCKWNHKKGRYIRWQDDLDSRRIIGIFSVFDL